MLKKLATFGLISLGILSMPRLNAATYTHLLTYTNTDNAGTAVLTGTVNFVDTDGVAQSSTTGLGDDIVSSFTPYITFTYTPTPGGTSYTLNTGNFTSYNLVIKSGVTVDYDGDPTLMSQLDKLQFGNTGGAFDLTMDQGGSGGFDMEAELPGGGGTANDFRLISTSQFPAPLPIFGLVPFFSSIRKLKKRFNLKLNK